MLASRVLPPVVRPSSPSPPAPVATFFHVPRRYVRSNMQVGGSLSNSPTDDAKPSRSLRKSNRIQDVRSAPTSNPTQRSKEDGLPSTALTSPRSTRKRVASLEEVINEEDSRDQTSPTDLRSPRSATSTQSGEFSPHVCLCQPEPKIPRPRNGKSCTPLSSDGSFQNGWCDSDGQRKHSLFADGAPQPLTSL